MRNKYDMVVIKVAKFQTRGIGSLDYLVIRYNEGSNLKRVALATLATFIGNVAKIANRHATEVGNLDLIFLLHQQLRRRLNMKRMILAPGNVAQIADVVSHFFGNLCPRF